MRNILYYWLSLYLLIPCTYAATWPQCNKYFKNETCIAFQNQGRFGIGIAVEYINSEAKLKDNFKPLGNVQRATRQQARKGFQGAPYLELGYTTSDNFYMGVLASWRYSGLSTAERRPLKHTYYFNHIYKLHHYTDILAKLGYWVTSKSMFYTLLGPSVAKWSHTTDEFNDRGKLDSLKMSSNTLGVGVGLGLEFLLSDRIFMDKVVLNVDYTHRFYKDKSGKKIMPFRDTLPMPPYYIDRPGLARKNIRPSSNTLAVRLTYFF